MDVYLIPAEAIISHGTGRHGETVEAVLAEELEVLDQSVSRLGDGERASVGLDEQLNDDDASSAHAWRQADLGRAGQSRHIGQPGPYRFPGRIERIGRIRIIDARRRDAGPLRHARGDDASDLLEGHLLYACETPLKDVP